MPEQWIVTVSGSQWLNANKHIHWGARNRLTQEWRGAAKVVAQSMKLPKLQRISILGWCVVLDNRRRDPANLHPTAKACVDGFVDAGLVLDDSDKYVIGPDLRLLVDRAARSPRIDFWITDEGAT